MQITNPHSYLDTQYICVVMILQEIAVIERERQRLEDLELQKSRLEHQLETCPTEEQITLLEKIQRQKELVDHQRKVFDDLEFQQLEV